MITGTRATTTRGGARALDSTQGLLGRGRRSLQAIAAVCGFLLAGSGAAQEVSSAQAAFPGSNGRIAFVSSVSGDPEIYTVAADGSDERNVTNNPAIDSDPAFSSDGSRIAFTSYRDGPAAVFAMNAEGSGVVRLTGQPFGDIEPAFSPDGSRIAFTSFRDGNAEIYVMNADGTGQTRLTNEAQADNAPAFSPDGSKIVFQSFRDISNPPQPEIYLMNADGTGQTRLTNTEAGNAEPAFSPDGSKIVFTRGFASPLNYDIFTIDPSGANETPVTTTSDSLEREPAFSPDATKIAFVTNATGVAQIFAMNLGGTGRSQLTASPGAKMRPDWGVVSTATPPPPQSPLPPPPPPPALPAPPPAAPAADLLTAKLAVVRARILRRDELLDVLAPITSLASGRARVELHAAGRRYRFTAPINPRDGRLRFRKRIPKAQADLGTGILTISYRGDSDTRPQTVRLRAAAQKAQLRLARPTVSADGRLRAAGTVSRRARGVVRVQLEYVVAGKTVTRQFLARIVNGRWSLNQALSQTVRDEIARRSGTVHSYTLFTGYQPALMRGEMRSYQVLGAR